jgi:hypothetical protein
VENGEYYTEILYLMGQNRIVSVQSNMEYNLPNIDSQEGLKALKNTTPQSRVVWESLDILVTLAKHNSVNLECTSGYSGLEWNKKHEHFAKNVIWQSTNRTRTDLWDTVQNHEGRQETDNKEELRLLDKGSWTEAALENHRSCLSKLMTLSSVLRVYFSRQQASGEENWRAWRTYTLASSWV